MIKCDNLVKEFDHLKDPDHMKALFQKQLPVFSEGDLIIAECVIEYINYKPYKDMSIRKKVLMRLCYKLEVMNFSSKICGVQMLYAKAYLDGQSWNEFQGIQHDHLCSPCYGHALAHLPDIGMIVWAFPNDPAMMHLPELIDPEIVKKHLPYDFFPSGLDGPKDVSDIKVEVVSYRPESHSVIRYHLEWQSSDDLRKFTLFGKTFSDNRGKKIYQWMDGIWSGDFKDSDDLLAAQPIDYNESVKTIWQKEQSGVRLEKIIDRSNYKELSNSVAGGLARIHKSALAGPPVISINEHFTDIKKKAVKLMQGLPRFREPIQSILCDLEKQIPHLSPAMDRVVHGDFSIDQLLVYEEKVVFLDFDDFAIGDPMQDLANFLVILHLRNFDHPFVNLVFSSFLDLYRSHISWSIPADRLRWYIRFQFIRKAYRLYTQQKTGLENIIQDIIQVMRGVKK